MRDVSEEPTSTPRRRATGVAIVAATLVLAAAAQFLLRHDGARSSSRDEMPAGSAAPQAPGLSEPAGLSSKPASAATKPPAPSTAPSPSKPRATRVSGHVLDAEGTPIAALAFLAVASFVSGTESVVTWTVAPHGWLTVSGDGKGLEYLSIAPSKGAVSEGLGRGERRRKALAVGTWTASWESSRDDKRLEATVDVEDGKEATLDLEKDGSPAR